MNISDILIKNKQWSRKKQQKKSDFFSQFSHYHHPTILWFGCVDARVCPERIVQASPGELLVCRNMANQFSLDEFSQLAILEFAITQLKIKKIIVCGHTQCAGIKSVLTDSQTGTCAQWLKPIAQLREEHASELAKFATENEQWDHLVKLNVLKQISVIQETDIVKEALKQDVLINIEGVIYDIETGLLNRV